MLDRIASPLALRAPGNLADRACAAAKVEQLLAEREARYPALVEAGKLSEEDAANGLILLRALAAQWRWAIETAQPALPIEPLSPFGASVVDLAAETRRIAERARAMADRSPGDDRAAETADLCEVIAWWQHIDGCGPRITGWVDCERRVAAAPALARAA